jgi:hypothetical protein
VVHPGGVARRAFEQDELERRLGDGEVGVAGTALGLISSERRGTWVYYRVNPEVMERMSAVLAAPRFLQPAR